MAIPKFDWEALQRFLQFYEKERLRYFPLIWGQKKPVVKWEALQNRAPTFEELAEWFQEGKPSNVAIICGAASNGLVALCFNALDGAVEFFGQKLWDKLLTSTFIVKTPRGVHVYLRSGTPIPTQFVPKGDNRSWLEIRADGNYIAAPPSLHPSGVLYEAIGVEKIAKPKNLPDFIEQQLAQLGLKARLAQEAKEKPLEPKKVVGRRKKHPPCLEIISQGVDEQQREAAALALARHYLIQAYEPGEVFWLLQEWDSKNKPPSYNEPLLEQMVRSAEKYRGLVCSLIKDKPTVSAFCAGDEKCDWPKPKKLEEEPLTQEEEPEKLNKIAVKKLLETCAFLRHCRKDAATLLEPHWWSMVHVFAVFGDLGREKIHELSQPYQKYTEKETEQKIEEALKAGEKEIGPHTCKFIEQDLGFGCPKDCPAKKLDVKSPAGMAKRLASQEIHGIYLYKDKAGWHLNLPKLVDDLLSEYSFKTMRDNEECLIYEDGIYIPQGEAKIKEECEKRVPKKFMHTYDINEVIGHIKRSTYVKRTKFNSEKWVLNLENGLYNIQTGELSSHTPEFLSTIRIPVSYDPSADCPWVRRFFIEVLRQEDTPVIEELFGYCLVPDYTIQRAFLFLGDGANGKSTLLELLKHLLGADNCTNMSLQAIEYQRFAKATLFGKLANIYADIPSTKMGHVGVFKTLTGGDTVDGEKKFKDRFSFNNTARLIFSTNKPPQVEEDTLAFWRRWIFINFPNKFEGKQVDKRLIQKLTKKSELSGLLNIALQGLKRLLNKQEYSYELSPDEIAEWHQKASDPIYAFVEDMCETDREAWISKDDLYEAFLTYCDRQNIPRIGKESFGRALKNAKNANVSSQKTGPRGAQVHGYKGIQLKKEQGEDINMEV